MSQKEVTLEDMSQNLKEYMMATTNSNGEPLMKAFSDVVQSPSGDQSSNPENRQKLNQLYQAFQQYASSQQMQQQQFQVIHSGQNNLAAHGIQMQRTEEPQKNLKQAAPKGPRFKRYQGLHYSSGRMNNQRFNKFNTDFQLAQTMRDKSASQRDAKLLGAINMLQNPFSCQNHNDSLQSTFTGKMNKGITATSRQIKENLEQLRSPFELTLVGKKHEALNQAKNMASMVNKKSKTANSRVHNIQSAIVNQNPQDTLMDINQQTTLQAPKQDEKVSKPRTTLLTPSEVITQKANEALSNFDERCRPVPNQSEYGFQYDQIENHDDLSMSHPRRMISVRSRRSSPKSLIGQVHSRQKKHGTEVNTSGIGNVIQRNLVCGPVDTSLIEMNASRELALQQQESNFTHNEQHHEKPALHVKRISPTKEAPGKQKMHTGSFKDPQQFIAIVDVTRQRNLSDFIAAKPDGKSNHKWQGQETLEQQVIDDGSVKLQKSGFATAGDATYSQRNGIRSAGHEADSKTSQRRSINLSKANNKIVRKVAVGSAKLATQDADEQQVDPQLMNQRHSLSQSSREDEEFDQLDMTDAAAMAQNCYATPNLEGESSAEQAAMSQTQKAPIEQALPESNQQVLKQSSSQGYLHRGSVRPSETSRQRLHGKARRDFDLLLDQKRPSQFTKRARDSLVADGVAEKRDFRTKTDLEMLGPDQSLQDLPESQQPSRLAPNAKQPLDGGSKAHLGSQVQTEDMVTKSIVASPDHPEAETPIQQVKVASRTAPTHPAPTISQPEIDGRTSVVLLSKSVPNHIDFNEPSLEEVRRVKDALEADQLIELDDSQLDNSQKSHNNTKVTTQKDLNNDKDKDFTIEFEDQKLEKKKNNGILALLTNPSDFTALAPRARATTANCKRGQNLSSSKKLAFSRTGAMLASGSNQNKQARAIQLQKEREENIFRMTHRSTAGQFLRKYHKSQRSAKTTMLKNVMENKLPIDKDVDHSSRYPQIFKQNVGEKPANARVNPQAVQSIRNQMIFLQQQSGVYDQQNLSGTRLAFNLTGSASYDPNNVPLQNIHQLNDDGLISMVMGSGQEVSQVVLGNDYLTANSFMNQWQNGQEHITSNQMPTDISPAGASAMRHMDLPTDLSPHSVTTGVQPDTHVRLIKPNASQLLTQMSGNVQPVAIMKRSSVGAVGQSSSPTAQAMNAIAFNSHGTGSETTAKKMPSRDFLGGSSFGVLPFTSAPQLNDKGGMNPVPIIESPKDAKSTNEQKAISTVSGAAITPTDIKNLSKVEASNLSDQESNSLGQPNIMQSNIGNVEAIKIHSNAEQTRNRSLALGTKFVDYTQSSVNRKGDTTSKDEEIIHMNNNYKVSQDKNLSYTAGNNDFNLTQSALNNSGAIDQPLVNGDAPVKVNILLNLPQQSEYQHQLPSSSPKQEEDNNLLHEDSQQLNEQQKKELDQMILQHITKSIVSKENIQNILDSKNQYKIIKAIDANYMNQTVFNKYAKTMAEREGIRTNTNEVMIECRKKIVNLYQNVSAYFNKQYSKENMLNTQPIQLSNPMLNTESGLFNLVGGGSHGSMYNQHFQASSPFCQTNVLRGPMSQVYAEAQDNGSHLSHQNMQPKADILASEDNTKSVHLFDRERDSKFSVSNKDVQMFMKGGEQKLKTQFNINDIVDDRQFTSSMKDGNETYAAVNQNDMPQLGFALGEQQFIINNNPLVNQNLASETHTFKQQTNLSRDHSGVLYVPSKASHQAKRQDGVSTNADPSFMPQTKPSSLEKKLNFNIQIKYKKERPKSSTQEKSSKPQSTQSKVPPLKHLERTQIQIALASEPNPVQIKQQITKNAIQMKYDRLKSAPKLPHKSALNKSQSPSHQREQSNNGAYVTAQVPLKQALLFDYAHSIQPGRVSKKISSPAFQMHPLTICSIRGTALKSSNERIRSGKPRNTHRVVRQQNSTAQYSLNSKVHSGHQELKAPVDFTAQLTPEQMNQEMMPMDRIVRQADVTAQILHENTDNTYSRQSSARRQQVVMMTRSQKPLTSKDTSIQVRVSNSIELNKQGEDYNKQLERLKKSIKDSKAQSYQLQNVQHNIIVSNLLNGMIISPKTTMPNANNQIQYDGREKLFIDKLSSSVILNNRMPPKPNQ